ncbi:head GIN domain-containing protein [Sphingomonas sp. DG1-23]|uniref:head GIN domain-containing protein n=1 Tax=Sphingomonas sp. DG1-23 TaxID=3068316 RepID=UPI00273D1037|nr:head GIN domain-containing protein [Sphingomonas sp. DG1-23]MDP5281348.1 head GIN domain-containing protein [Sphingomonas sp. DG1-23]
MRMLLMVALLPLAACQSNWEKKGDAAQASGSGATRSYAASGFTGVELRGSDDVDVKIGQSFAVTAEGDPKVLDQLDIRVVGGTLRVGRKNSKDGWFGTDHGARIHVVMPRLTAASVGGSGNLTADRGEGDFSGAVSGSGNLTIANLRAGDADLSIAGSGDMRVAGSATKLSASVAGSGDMDAKQLTAASADVSIAGSGNVLGTVKGPASVSIVGSGDAELGGGAKCSVNAVGSGEARCT